MNCHWLLWVIALSLNKPHWTLSLLVQKILAYLFPSLFHSKSCWQVDAGHHTSHTSLADVQFLQEWKHHQMIALPLAFWDIGSRPPQHPEDRLSTEVQLALCKHHEPTGEKLLIKNAAIHRRRLIYTNNRNVTWQMCADMLINIQCLL